jgi:Domain of unknown function (DUF4386)
MKAEPNLRSRRRSPAGRKPVEAETKARGRPQGERFFPQIARATIEHLTKPQAARLAGLSYVLLAVTGVYTDVVKKKLIVGGDASATAEKILASEGLFVLNIFSELMTATSWSLIAIALFALFRKVQPGMAVLMLSLVLIGSAVLVINTAFQIAALIVLQNATGSLTSFSTVQLKELALLFLDTAGKIVIADFIFMGLWMFPFAFFVVKSGFFPRTASLIWSFLLVVGGFGYLFDYVTYFHWPDAYVDMTSFAFWGDVFSILWLLLGRVDLGRS